LARQGPNQVDATPRLGLLAAFLTRFRNPLILMLVGAAGILAFTGDMRGFVIIAVMVVCSVVLDVTQEYRAGNAAAALKSRVALRARAVRDGDARAVPAAQLVPGDLVCLEAGDLVPADGRLVEARDLYVNEALITGESFPAEKQVGDTAQGRLMMGSSVLSGTAKMLVEATGRQTRLGAIAHTLVKPPPPTAFALSLRDFSLMIVRLSLVLTLVTVAGNLLLHRPALQSFLFAVALAVGLTPELLPMVVSIGLAHGAVRLSRMGMIVKKLSAIHDLGGMDILCSDKTGTLTEAAIRLVAQVDALGASGGRALALAAINARFETGIENPLDTAMLTAAPNAADGWRKLDEVPFDFARRRVSILAEKDNQRLLLVKGAPEEMLAICDRFEDTHGSLLVLDEDAREKAQALLDRMEQDGLRLLGVAWHDGAERDRAGIGDEGGLVLAGFLGFLDPPKGDAGAALSDLAALGVRTIVLTGDSAGVSRHVCGALGLNAGVCLSGQDIAAMSEEALEARLAGTTIFCRMSPPQKLRVIAALRRQGHVVGYLGDGLNDAPSLHEADVGISVDQAVDVAREAAAIIMTAKDLGLLAEGVREGRRTFTNIFKYVLMGTSSNVGNMVSMSAGALLLPFLPMLPVQILFNNLLYDISQTAIPMDRVDASALASPRHWDTHLVRRFALLLGSLSSLFDFVTFYILLSFSRNETLFHTGWFVESLATQLLVIFVIRSRDPLHSRAHPLLVASTVAVLGVAVALPYTPLSSWLGFAPLPLPLLAVLTGITSVYLLAAFAVRRWCFSRLP